MNHRWRWACLALVSVASMAARADPAADARAMEKDIDQYKASLKGQNPVTSGERDRIAAALSVANELGKSATSEFAAYCLQPDRSALATARCVHVASALKEWAHKLAAPKPGESGRATVSQAAAESQDKVDKLRLKYRTAYERGDAATALAIEIADDSTLGSGAGRAHVPEQARNWTDKGLNNPRLLKDAISIAQKKANILVVTALELRRCGIDDSACTSPLVAKGLVANAIFVDAVSRADHLDNELSEAKLGLTELKVNPHSTPTDLTEAVAFRKLLEDNPDVKSFFGGEAVGFSAGSNDSTVSFRHVTDLSGSVIRRRNRISWIFTAPTNKDTRANFVDSADALKNLTSVKLGWQFTNLPFKLPGTGTLNDFALGLAAGQGPRSFLVPNNANPNQATEQKKNYTTLSAGVRWAFLTQPTSDYKTLFVLGFDAQRRYIDGNVETRCPASTTPPTPGLTSCFTGSWGEPTRVYSRLLGFEVRQHMPAFDIGLKLKQDLKTDKLDAEIPIYLIRDIADDAKKVPFTAGISLSRTSGDRGLKWGLFVSAPLNFLSPGPDPYESRGL